MYYLNSKSDMHYEMKLEQKICHKDVLDQKKGSFIIIIIIIMTY